MMKRFMSKKAVAVGLAVGLTLGVAGAAFAYWNSSGSGSGNASTGSATNSLSITQTSTISGLAPGVPAQTITGSIQNTQGTGGQNEQVNNVVVSIGSVTESPAIATEYPGYACSAADYTLTNATMAVNTDLTPGQTANFTGATLAFNDLTTTNQDACQGATVNLSYVSN
jgi:hypothetical protein